MGKHTLPLLGAGLAALTAAATGAVYNIAFHTPNRTQNDDFSVVKTKKVAPIYDDILTLIRTMNSIPYEPVYITSHDGLRLRARLYDARPGAPVAICFHGWRGTPSRDFSGGASMLIRNGWRVLLIEQRGQKGSEGHTMTFGAKERLDCLRWTRWAADRSGAESKIMLFGISMGAATVLLASELDFPRSLRGIIADCPYSSPRKIIVNTAAGMHIPGWTLIFARIGAALLGGFKLTDIDASDCVKKSKVPILIIHGEADSFVPPYMSEGPAEACPETVKRITVPGADHALSFLVDPEKYKAAVEEFFRRTMRQQPIPAEQNKA